MHGYVVPSRIGTFACTTLFSRIQRLFWKKNM